MVRGERGERGGGWSERSEGGVGSPSGARGGKRPSGARAGCFILQAPALGLCSWCLCFGCFLIRCVISTFRCLVLAFAPRLALLSHLAFPPSLTAFPGHLPFPPSLTTFPCRLPFPPSLATFPCQLPLPPFLTTFPCHLPFRPCLSPFLLTFPSAFLLFSCALCFRPRPSNLPGLPNRLPNRRLDLPGRPLKVVSGILLL